MPAPWAHGASCRIIGELHGQQTVNVLHFATNTSEFDVGSPSPLLTALVTAVLACVIETLLPAVTSDWKCVQVVGNFIYNGGPGQGNTDAVFATAPANSIGTRGQTSVSFASSLMNIRTGLAGRSGRGRAFLPPPGEADIAQSNIDPTTMDLLVTFLTCLGGKFMGTSPSTDWRIGVFSRKINAQTLGGGFDSAFIQAGQLSPVSKLAVISRRKIGHGR